MLAIESDFRYSLAEFERADRRLADAIAAARGARPDPTEWFPPLRPVYWNRILQLGKVAEVDAVVGFAVKVERAAMRREREEFRAGHAAPPVGEVAEVEVALAAGCCSQSAEELLWRKSALLRLLQLASHQRQ